MMCPFQVRARRRQVGKQKEVLGAGVRVMDSNHSGSQRHIGLTDTTLKTLGLVASTTDLCGSWTQVSTMAGRN